VWFPSVNYYSQIHRDSTELWLSDAWNTTDAHKEYMWVDRNQIEKTSTYNNSTWMVIFWTRSELHYKCLGKVSQFGQSECSGHCNLTNTSNRTLSNILVPFHLILFDIVYLLKYSDLILCSFNSVNSIF
jgi:hypothetical protein